MKCAWTSICIGLVSEKISDEPCPVIQGPAQVARLVCVGARILLCPSQAANTMCSIGRRKTHPLWVGRVFTDSRPPVQSNSSMAARYSPRRSSTRNDVWQGEDHHRLLEPIAT